MNRCKYGSIKIKWKGTKVVDLSLPLHRLSTSFLPPLSCCLFQNRVKRELTGFYYRVTCQATKPAIMAAPMEGESTHPKAHSLDACTLHTRTLNACTLHICSLPNWGPSSNRSESKVDFIFINWKKGNVIKTLNGKIETEAILKALCGFLTTVRQSAATPTHPAPQLSGLCNGKRWEESFLSFHCLWQLWLTIERLLTMKIAWDIDYKFKSPNSTPWWLTYN